MPTEDAQVVIAGLGAMGSAACFHLARRGVDVVGFDKHDVPNLMGSSGGESRIIRLCYFEHPDYVPLLQRSYTLWHELARDAQQPIIEITGGLFVGAPDSGLVSGSKRAADEHTLPHEMLSHAVLRERFPQFAVTDEMIALYEPTGGFIRPEMAIAAHARLAQQHGARIHAHEPVIDWRADDAGVFVTTSQRTVRAKKLVVCAGPWTAQLVHALGSTLTVTRQILAWVMPSDPAPFALGALPVWAMEHSEGDFHYGFPILDPAKGLKLGRHDPAEQTNPDDVVRRALAGDEDVVRPFLRKHMPGANGPLREVYVCMYTNSPDAHFLIDRHPEHDNVLIATGFSGHGFKFATVIGEALADLAQRGATDLPIGFLGRKRLA